MYTLTGNRSVLDRIQALEDASATTQEETVQPLNTRLMTPDRYWSMLLQSNDLLGYPKDIALTLHANTPTLLLSASDPYADTSDSTIHVESRRARFSFFVNVQGRDIQSLTMFGLKVNNPDEAPLYLDCRITPITNPTMAAIPKSPFINTGLTLSTLYSTWNTRGPGMDFLRHHEGAVVRDPAWYRYPRISGTVKNVAKNQDQHLIIKYYDVGYNVALQTDWDEDITTIVGNDSTGQTVLVPAYYQYATHHVRESVKVPVSTNLSSSENITTITITNTEDLKNKKWFTEVAVIQDIFLSIEDKNTRGFLPILEVTSYTEDNITLRTKSFNLKNDFVVDTNPTILIVGPVSQYPIHVGMQIWDESGNIGGITSIEKLPWDTDLISGASVFDFGYLKIEYGTSKRKLESIYFDITTAQKTLLETINSEVNSSSEFRFVNDKFRFAERPPSTFPEHRVPVSGNVVDLTSAIDPTASYLMMNLYVKLHYETDSLVCYVDTNKKVHGFFSQKYMNSAEFGSDLIAKGLNSYHDLMSSLIESNKRANLSTVEKMMEEVKGLYFYIEDSPRQETITLYGAFASGDKIHVRDGGISLGGELTLGDDSASQAATKLAAHLNAVNGYTASANGAVVTLSNFKGAVTVEITAGATQNVEIPSYVVNEVASDFGSLSSSTVTPRPEERPLAVVYDIAYTVPNTKYIVYQFCISNFEFTNFKRVKSATIEVTGGVRVHGVNWNIELYEEGQTAFLNFNNFTTSFVPIDGSSTNITTIVNEIMTKMVANDPLWLGPNILLAVEYASTPTIPTTDPTLSVTLEYEEVDITLTVSDEEKWNTMISHVTAEKWEGTNLYQIGLRKYHPVTFELENPTFKFDFKDFHPIVNL